MVKPYLLRIIQEPKFSFLVVQQSNLNTFSHEKIIDDYRYF